MRYALYYSPAPSSLFWELGCKWLGRDPLTQKKIVQDHFSGVNPDRLYELTKTAGRYGLHATLKAPFRMAPLSSESNLRSDLNVFSRRYSSFLAPPLELRQIDDFFCLCPQVPSVQLNSLADDCVRTFDEYRAPLTRIELARRRAEILTTEEKKHLSTWGYPYVMDQFRFHITLTGRISDAYEKIVIRAMLSQIFEPVIGKPFLIEAVSLFIEPALGQPFIYSERYPLNDLERIVSQNPVKVFEPTIVTA